MQKLTVADFSCIDHAELELGKLTLLIGPQASGKSVLSKLVYFFNDVWSQQFWLMLQGNNFDAYTSYIRQNFLEIFPVDAWGKKQFQICFEASVITIKVFRSQISFQ